MDNQLLLEQPFVVTCKECQQVSDPLEHLSNKLALGQEDKQHYNPGQVRTMVEEELLQHCSCMELAKLGFKDMDSVNSLNQGREHFAFLDLYQYQFVHNLPFIPNSF